MSTTNICYCHDLQPPPLSFQGVLVLEGSRQFHACISLTDALWAIKIDTVLMRIPNVPSNSLLHPETQFNQSVPFPLVSVELFARSPQ